MAHETAPAKQAARRAHEGIDNLWHTKSFNQRGEAEQLKVHLAVTRPTSMHPPSLTPFIPGNVAPQLPSEIDALLGDEALPMPSVSQTQVPVIRWEPVVVGLVTGGMSVTDAAMQVKQEPEVVSAFLSSASGKEMIKGQIEARPVRLEKMLQGFKIDVALQMHKIAMMGKQESSRVAAGKVLLDLAEDLKPKEAKTPEERKRALEAKLREREKGN